MFRTEHGFARRHIFSVIPRARTAGTPNPGRRGSCRPAVSQAVRLDGDKFGFRDPPFFLLTGWMSHPRSKDPLHGITLEKILTELVERHGWEEMGHRISIRCFQFDPSIKSSLAFLRKTPWARAKVEQWYVQGKPAE